MSAAMPTHQRFRPLDTGYSFASVHRPARPLAVFAVLYHGRPIIDIDGLPVEHGSHQAADDHARRMASTLVTALSNFSIRREWI